MVFSPPSPSSLDDDDDDDDEGTAWASAVSDEVLRPRDAPPALGPTPTVAEQKAVSASAAIARAARAKRSLPAREDAREAQAKGLSPSSAGTPQPYSLSFSDLSTRRYLGVFHLPDGVSDSEDEESCTSC